MRIEFDSKEHLKKLEKTSDYFDTFLVKDSLEVGVLSLRPGDKDTQEPHDADEAYYVIRGNGYLRINKKDYPVREGKVFFVKKDIPHYFHGNTKLLDVLYFFGSSN